MSSSADSNPVMAILYLLVVVGLGVGAFMVYSANKSENRYQIFLDEGKSIEATISSKSMEKRATRKGRDRYFLRVSYKEKSLAQGGGLIFDNIEINGYGYEALKEGDKITILKNQETEELILENNKYNMFGNSNRKQIGYFFIAVGVLSLIVSFPIKKRFAS